MHSGIYSESASGMKSHMFDIDEELMKFFHEQEPEDDDPEDEDPEDEEPEDDGPEDEEDPDDEEPEGEEPEDDEPEDEEPEDEPARGDDDHVYQRQGNTLRRREPSKEHGKRVSDIIRTAAREHRVLRLTYIKLNGERTTRILEPYSYRVQYPQRTGRIQRWYLFAYDRTKDELIKSFLVRRMVSAEIGQEQFTPRWEVEF